MIKVEREAKQRILIPVTSFVDPTSGAISFAFPIRGERPVFVAGTWSGAAVIRNGVYVRDAFTPRIGEDPDLAKGHYRFFGRLIIGGDEEIWEIDKEGLEVG